MNSLKNTFKIFASILIVSLILIYFYSLNLPERVFIHFNTYGEAEGFAWRNTFLIFSQILVIFIGALFYSISKLIYKVDPKWLNLPNKDYWLTEERKQSTLNKVRDYNYIFGIVNLLLFDLLFYAIYKANLLAQPKLGAISYISIIGYILISTFILIKFYRDFQIND